VRVKGPSDRSAPDRSRATTPRSDGIKLDHTRTMRTDKANGPAVNYYPDGKTRKAKGDFTDGRRTGMWTFFDKKGKRTGDRRY
jgi:hypothetical protein